MSTPDATDTAALNLMLGELRLPTIKALWPQFTAQADREGWPHALLRAAVPLLLRTRCASPAAICPPTAPRCFIARCQRPDLRSLPCPPACPDTPSTPPPPPQRHSNLHRRAVQFNQPYPTWPRPRRSRPAFAVRGANSDRLLLIMCSCTLLDDFSYVTKDQAETSVLFELISARYEQRSLLITANQPSAAPCTTRPPYVTLGLVATSILILIVARFSP